MLLSGFTDCFVYGARALRELFVARCAKVLGHGREMRVANRARCRPLRPRPGALAARPLKASAGARGRARARAMTTRAPEKIEATTALALSQRCNATRSAQDSFR